MGGITLALPSLRRICVRHCTFSKFLCGSFCCSVSPVFFFLSSGNVLHCFFLHSFVFVKLWLFDVCLSSGTGASVSRDCRNICRRMPTLSFQMIHQQKKVGFLYPCIEIMLVLSSGVLFKRMFPCCHRHIHCQMKSEKKWWAVRMLAVGLLACAVDFTVWTVPSH